MDQENKQGIEETSSVPASEGQAGRGRRFPFFLSRNKYLLVVGLFTLAGVIGGFAYYTFIGCKTGTCTITSSPTLSIIWGGAMGYLLPDFFFKQKK